MNLPDRVRRALIRAVISDDDVKRVIRKTMAHIRATKEGLVYISPLNIMVDQEGHLYWVEKTDTYRLHAISEAPPEERMDALWARKPKVKDDIEKD